MNNKQFYAVFGAALEDTSREAFVSDWTLSSIFTDPNDPAQTMDEELAAKLGTIWDVAHMTVKELRAASGMTRPAFAERFCIPLRTVQDWELGQRNPPDYVRLMMAQLLGVIDR